jgi:hypothetical protein
MMHSMGLQKDCPIAEGISLADMVQAGSKIKKHEDKRQSGTITVVCDDRLIAAIYAMTHYRGQPNGNPEPILAARGKALVCVDVSKLKASHV